MYNHLLNKHTTTTDSSERYIFYFVSIMKASGGVYCAVLDFKKNVESADRM